MMPENLIGASSAWQIGLPFLPNIDGNLLNFRDRVLEKAP